jgi:hypothetical protein
MPPNLLDDLVIEMARVAHELLANLVCVLQSAEDIVNQRHLSALLQIGTLGFPACVDLLDPGMMGRR